MKKFNFVSVTAIIAVTVVATATTRAGEIIRIQAPTVMPRDQRLGNYSPAVSFSYSGLQGQPYTLKVWLLEEDTWNCASSQWCERSFAINSRREAAADGSLQIVSPFDVYDYGPSLTWVARLFNGEGIEVASAKAQSRAVAGKPPVLKPTDKRVGATGQELRFILTEAAPLGERVTFRIHQAPADAKLDSQTGMFSWTPTAPGLYRIVVEAVS